MSKTNCHVAVASLGGTITMTSSRPDGRGVQPSLGAADLLSAVPGLDELTVDATTLATIPGASLSIADLFQTLQWARQAVTDGASGAVIIQGTDTIEETAYLLDLYWDRPEPVIVTGAMRPAQAVGADGPANLAAAVTAAADRSSRDRGALVVMADQIHSARWVCKRRSSGQGAFQSPSFGPLGYVEEGTVLYRGLLQHPSPIAPPATAPSAKVAMIETCLGDDGHLLKTVAGAGFDGIVLAGFGVGHVPPAVAEIIGAITPNIPVVVTSRTGDGPTYAATYGFTGSESDLLRRGAILAGWLDARKARLLLMGLLSAGHTRSEIMIEVGRRGWAKRPDDEGHDGS